MDDTFREIVGSGSLALAIPLAVLAGLVSFFSRASSRCSPATSPTRPVCPAPSSPRAGSRGRRGRMLLGSGLFVLGFSVVFVSLGVGSASINLWVNANERVLNVVLGVLTVLLGLAFLGLVPARSASGASTRCQRSPRRGAAARRAVRDRLDAVPRAHPGGDPEPCLRPRPGARRRAVAFYSLGLGVPFVLAGLAWHRALGAVAFVRRHQAWVVRIGGVMLIGIGVLLLTGWWSEAVQWLQIHLVGGFEVSV